MPLSGVASARAAKFFLRDNYNVFVAPGRTIEVDGLELDTLPGPHHP